MSVELKQLAISAAEWEIMRVVWAEGAVTSRQVIDTMLGLSDWKEGTIKSMLNRLTKKGVLTQDTTDALLVFEFDFFRGCNFGAD